MHKTLCKPSNSSMKFGVNFFPTCYFDLFHWIINVLNGSRVVHPFQKVSNCLSLDLSEESLFTAVITSVQLLSRVRLFATPWIAACQASLSITNSLSSLKLMSIVQWCHPSISTSVVPFSSCPQSLPAYDHAKFSYNAASSVNWYIWKTGSILLD